MARLKNPALDAIAVSLATTVVLSERLLLPLLQAGLKSLEMLVTSLERKELPMPKLQAEPSRELAFVEVDSTDHVRLKEIQTETE